MSTSLDGGQYVWCTLLCS